MYKTISIHNNAYQKLNAISARLDKPKAQVIEELIDNFSESVKEKEKKELQEYNTFVASLVKRVRLPKGIRIKSESLDKELEALKDQEV